MSRSPTRVLPRDDRQLPESARPPQRDGVSQQRRPLPALDPGSVRLDDRTTRDLLRFTRELADNVTFVTADTALEQLRAEGTWLPFLQRDDVSIDDIVAYIDDPARFTGERARWLGRPHFALLITFLELMRHARDQLNGVVGRHLDYYYRDVLGMTLERAVADRAAIVFTAASGSDDVRIPEGTEVQAGRDAAGRPRVYRTERELLVNQSQVAALRSVYVDRERVGLADVRKDESLTVGGVLDYMLRLAVGRPKAGDQIEDFEKRKVNTSFLASLLPFLDFARDVLRLEHHELRSLIRLHTRRGDAANPEWERINALIGVANPPDPRDFHSNLASRIGEVDFKLDGWPEIESFDDLFVMRDDSKTDADGTVITVRSLIEKIFAPFGAAGFDTFVELMSLKRRIDAEWREINRLLDIAGRRRRKSFTWTLQSLDDFDPTAFAVNLLIAQEGKPQWPSGVNDIFEYAARVRRLERHLSMPAERLRAVAAFAAKHGTEPQAGPLEWKPIERALADAHVEQSRAGRRLRLEVARGTSDNRQGLVAVVNAALHTEARPLTWPDALARLAAVLEPAQSRLLDQFYTDLGEELRSSAFGWEDAYRLIDLATRALEGVADPIAERLWLRNVYAHDDATSVLVDAQRSKRWYTFARK
ncbi:MAG: hypothetical protein JNK04_26235, partial [Myxococcales bacterium]|nr:hypothetical protein [Myxococcales bacterium]